MGLLLDIVPNHMAASEENSWWMDLLENGRQSEFASYFDIDWAADPLQRSRILLPVLGDMYGKVLESQGLSLHYDDQGFFVRYYQNRDFRFARKPIGKFLAAASRNWRTRRIRRCRSQSANNAPAKVSSELSMQPSNTSEGKCSAIPKSASSRMSFGRSIASPVCFRKR